MSAHDELADFERAAGISPEMSAALRRSLAQMGFDLGSNAIMYADAVKRGMEGFSKKTIWEALKSACQEDGGDDHE
jgi:hypothetical protein